jgi:hypothetical protein
MILSGQAKFFPKLGPRAPSWVFFCLFVFETGSYSVAQAGLQLKILLSQSPRCWDYRVHHHALLLPEPKWKEAPGANPLFCEGP